MTGKSHRIGGASTVKIDYPVKSGEGRFDADKRASSTGGGAITPETHDARPGFTFTGIESASTVSTY